VTAKHITGCHDIKGAAVPNATAVCHSSEGMLLDLSEKLTSKHDDDDEIAYFTVR